MDSGLASGSLIFYTVAGILLVLSFGAYVMHAVLLAQGRRIAAALSPREPAFAGVATGSFVDSREAAWAAGVDQSPAGPFARGLTTITAVVLGLSMLMRAVLVGRGPWGNLFEFSVAFATSILGAYLALGRRYPIQSIGFIPVGVALGVALYASSLPSDIKPLVPALANAPLLTIHVGMAMLSYGIFATSFAAGVGYLIQGREERQFAWLPSHKVLDSVAYRAVIIGFPVFATMIILGSWWASIAWAAYWSWDPKETAALVTWLAYAIYLHARNQKAWAGRRRAAARRRLCDGPRDLLGLTLVQRPPRVLRPELTTSSSAAAPVRRARTLRARLGPAYRRVRDLALAPVYAVYLQRLRARVMSEPRPEHIAVIMDGNRRWATAEGYDDPGAGHRAGAEKALELIDWCAQTGIHEITLWALSLETLAGPGGGRHDHRRRRRGDPGDGRGPAQDAPTDLPAGHRPARPPAGGPAVGRRIVGRAVARGRHDGGDGRLGLLRTGRAARSISIDGPGRGRLGVPAERMADELTAESIADHLYTRGSTEPDLIIRTSGEVRLSGFLPWEFGLLGAAVLRGHPPAFREIDFLRALRTYQQRARRFGR